MSQKFKANHRFALSLTAIATSTLLSGFALAQTAADEPEKVVVTGSMIRRSAAETTEAITTISADKLKDMGITTVEQALQLISSNQSTALTLTAVSSWSGGGSFANLRGLGPSKTLVLLDGQRLANNVVAGNAVDLNGIPFAAIERIEVLREGASSIYGTDAIAGVINFITKKNLTEGELNLNVAKPQHPGGGSNNFDITWGKGDLIEDGYNILFAFNHQQQQELTASQRPFAATGYNPALGLDNQNGPMGTWPGSYTDHSGLGNTYQVGYPGCAGNTHLVPNNGNCAYLYSAVVDLIPPSTENSGLISFNKQIDSETKLNVQYFRSQFNLTTWGGPQTYSFYMSPQNNPTYFPTAANSTGFGTTVAPDLTDPILAGWTDPNNNRYINDKNTEQRFLTSLTGKLVGWDYNTAFVYSQNSNVQGVSGGYANYNILAPNGYLSNLINPFGPQSAAGQALINSSYMNGALSSGALKLYDYNFNASHEVGDLFSAGRSATLALGADLRHEEISYNPTDLATTLYPATYYPPAAVNGGRNEQAIYGELNIPITKNFEATISDREDRYSDFGTTNNAKIAARYQPTEEVTFRSAYSTGFRAPSLVDLYQPQVLGADAGTMNGPPCASGGSGNVFTSSNCQAQGMSLTGGNPNLKPEKSKNFDFGIVLSPVANLGMTLDFYSVQVNNEIQSIPDVAIYGSPSQFQNLYHLNNAGTLTQAPTANTFCANGPSSPSCGYIIQTLQNTGGIKTTGLDFSTNYTLRTSTGKYRFGMEGTYVASFKLQEYAGGPWQGLGGQFNGGNQPVIRWQHLLTMDWTQDEWGAGLSNHFLASYTDEFPNANGQNITVGSYSIWNAYASWKPTKSSKIIFGIRNLFDTNPPFSNQVNNWQAGYNPLFSDPTGRTFYAKLNYVF